MANFTSSNNRSTFENIHSLKKHLNSAVSTNNTQEIKNILVRLRSEVVPTEEIIRTTKIGISVAKQRQHSDPEISKLAKSIVIEWKSGVKKDPQASSSSHQSVGASSSQPHNSSKVKSPNSSGLSSQDMKKSPQPSSAKSTSLSSAATPTTPVLTKTATLSGVASAKKLAMSNSQDSSSPFSNSINQKQQQQNRIEVRSSKTEPSLNFEPMKDKVRDGCMKALFDALVFDSDAPSDLVYDRATSIEAEVNRTHDTQGYKAKMRSLIFNLKDKNNPGLREAVVSGEVSCKRLCTMAPADMASEERKAQDRKLAEENLFKARGAGPQQAETDGFRCGRCGQRKCTYYQMQTRSADEPMTTFVTCVNCNNRWKFS